MFPPPVVTDIRAARCTVCNPTAFLMDLRAVAVDHDTHIICFNADMIAGRVHAAFAVARAVRAFEGRITISNTLEMESLLLCRLPTVQYRGLFWDPQGREPGIYLLLPRAGGGLGST